MSPTSAGGARITKQAAKHISRLVETLRGTGCEPSSFQRLVIPPDRPLLVQPVTGSRVRCFWWTAAPSTSAPTRGARIQKGLKS